MMERMNPFTYIILCTAVVSGLASCTFTSQRREPGPDNIPGAVPIEVTALMRAYPDCVKGFKGGCILMRNRKKIPFERELQDTSFLNRLDSASVRDMFAEVYPLGRLKKPEYLSDPGRFRDDAFFKAMYGDSLARVSSRLTRVDVFGTSVRFTTVNGAADSLRAVLREVEKHPGLKRYFKAPTSFNWRPVRGTERLSAHSYGIALDIGVPYSDYWRWSNPGKGELDELDYHNRFPARLIRIFERHGFISGARWYHYDTMHFEFRPELIEYARMSR